jgi:hypothetical protein
MGTLARSICRLRGAALVLPSLITVVGLFGTTPASAAGTAYWRLATNAAPSTLAPGSQGRIIVTAANLGNESNSPAKSSAITLTDKLPAGITATAVSGYFTKTPEDKLTCELKPLRCTDSSFTVLPSTSLRMVIQVEVGANVLSNKPEEQENEVAVSGGEGLTPASGKQLVHFGTEPVVFGAERYEFRPEEEGGATDTQAGSHPYQLTTFVSFNLNAEEQPIAAPKNLNFTLPPGLIGNPIAIPRCSQADFNTLAGEANLCPADTVLGVAEVVLEEAKASARPISQTVPVFNVEPAAGEPARLGFTAFKVPVVLETSVRTGSDYAVVVSAKRTSNAAPIFSSRVQVWGVPGDARHNNQRGWECVEEGALKPPFFPSCSEQKRPPEVPFLSMPTACGETQSPMQAQSWDPGAQLTAAKPSEFPLSFTGCNLLSFGPEMGEAEAGLIGVEPFEGSGGERKPLTSGSTPAGLTTRVSNPGAKPQAETPTGLAQSAVRSTSVLLPEGLQLSAGAANGLAACSAFEVGLAEGAEELVQTENNHFTPEPARCPNASKVGTVSIKSPDLQEPLTGSAYLAREHTNPFEAPLVLYLIAEAHGEDCQIPEEGPDPCGSGVRVKLAGKVIPNPVTGQIESIFENTPQVPFEKLTVSFFPGPRASVATPSKCGTYTTTTSFTPWSGNEPHPSQSSFAITSGCSNGTLPFAPTVAGAGPRNPQAGAFSPFDLTIGHTDGDQALETLTVHLPPGAAAMLSSVTPCPEPQAALNQCGPESLVGKSTAVGGLGSEPVTLQGNVYLTTGYKGSPFGLSVVTPAVVGPFNLGLVTVRSRIDVDRSTAVVTVTSDPFPTIIKGAPVQLKEIHVEVDRPNFEFNGTNCNPMAVSGTMGGSEGGSVGFAFPHQLVNCAGLPFHPTLTASVSSQGSKANGVTFIVKVESQGLGVANPQKVDVQIPAALPSRLTTIQKACPDTVFEVNPATCDEGSVIGHAIIHTPVLKNPLTGPAYLVSHGNAAFPDVEFLLQGEGLTILLDGKTDIKKGITYSRFESNPDAPFTVFETILPAGPHSALTDFVAPSKNYNLCGEKLDMPTEMTGQNGDFFQTTTHVQIVGCSGVLHQMSRHEKLVKCERAARHKYKGRKNRHKLSKALRSCRKKYGPKKHTSHHKSTHKSKKHK